MKRLVTIISFLLLIINTGNCQTRFFKEYPADFSKEINNITNGRLRVNDTNASLNPDYGNRGEVRSNGLMLISVPENLFSLEKAELYLELWGGHPGTENKHFSLNGKQIYSLPEVGAAAGHCVYSYPIVPVKTQHLVNGANALLFSCEKPKGWGHYIIEHATIRCYLAPDHPVLTKNGLHHFSAEIKLASSNCILGDEVGMQLTYPKSHESSIDSVVYFGRYLDFDENGDGIENDWHGFSINGKFENHLGTVSEPPFQIVWNTGMIPEQGKPLGIKALVCLKNGVRYWTPVRDGLYLSKNRKPVTLIPCTSMPVPFWARASREMKATMILPDNIDKIEQAMLLIKTWYTQIEHSVYHFSINNHEYTIIPEGCDKKPLLSKIDVNPAHLKSGDNEISLFCDTRHHGIEVLLPGPCLLIRYHE